MANYKLTYKAVQDLELATISFFIQTIKPEKLKLSEFSTNKWI